MLFSSSELFFPQLSTCPVPPKHHPHPHFIVTLWKPKRQNYVAILLHSISAHLLLIPPPSVKLHHSYPCLISLWSTVSEVTRFCGSEWWSREGTSESFESQIKSTFRQTNPFVVQQCESTLGWINRVKIMILSGGKQGTTKWLSSEHTSYLRFVNFDTPPHCLGL